MNVKVASLIAAVLWTSAIAMGGVSIAYPHLRFLWMGAVSDGIVATVFTFIAAKLWVGDR
jgi:hypothetical protein